MPYSLIFDKKLVKDFKKISKVDIVFIKKSLNEFVKNFNDEYEKNLLKTKKIKLLKGQNQELFRLKIRTYRAIYKKQDNKLIILVISVKSRSSVYKKL